MATLVFFLKVGGGKKIVTSSCDSIILDAVRKSVEWSRVRKLSVQFLGESN